MEIAPLPKAAIDTIIDDASTLLEAPGALEVFEQRSRQLVGLDKLEARKLGHKLFMEQPTEAFLRNPTKLVKAKALDSASLIHTSEGDKQPIISMADYALLLPEVNRPLNEESGAYEPVLGPSPFLKDAVYSTVYIGKPQQAHKPIRIAPLPLSD